MKRLLHKIHSHKNENTMNPFQQLIAQAVTRTLSKQRGSKSTSKYGLGREYYNLKTAAFRLVKDSLLIITGILSAGFGLEAFLLPNSFIDGGVTGISLLTTELTKYPLPILIIIINIPFVVLGFTQVGKTFAIKSIIAIIGLALAITFIHYPVITSDKLLVAVFGGFFIGAGIGFVPEQTNRPNHWRYYPGI